MKFRFRTVVEEFEAHVHPIQPDSNLRGKSEWKHYADGSYRFKLSLRGLDLPDNSEIDIWRDGSWFMRLTVQNQKAKVDLENEGGSGIPTIKPGQVLQIKYANELLAEGEYKVE
jgi:hypothetical protein